MTPKIPADRILLIQFRKIGDVLLSTPVVRALRQHYPKSYIAYCAEPGPAGVLKGNTMLDEILLYPRPATLRDAWQFIRRVRRYDFDLVNRYHRQSPQRVAFPDERRATSFSIRPLAAVALLHHIGRTSS